MVEKINMKGNVEITVLEICNIADNVSTARGWIENLTPENLSVNKKIILHYLNTAYDKLEKTV